MVDFFSFFHLYGLIIGIAIVVAYSLIEKKLKLHDSQQNSNVFSLFNQTWIFIVLVGIIGARLWHVVTDWQLYQDNPIASLYIWQGGLSIIGGVVGGVVAILWIAKKKQLDKHLLLDALVFGLPFGQAIGRLGNYVNQELYGLPTTLPWGIFIDSKNRLPQYKQSEYFHPLFFYEMVATIIFGCWVWWFDRQKNVIGTGWYTYAYILYYAVIRILLDFIRPDKSYILLDLGVNQLFLLIVAVYSGIQLKKIYEKK